MTIFNITIISDTVCPFCYLGRARLSRVITLYRKTVPGGSSSTFNIRWHACRLDDNPPAKSVLVTDVAAKKFGADRLVAKREWMSQLGAQEGFTFTFGGRIGNTRDSHRVIQLGRTKGAEVEDRGAMVVMKMLFEEGGDITSWYDLAGAAETAGIEAAETKAWLEGGGGEQVDSEVEQAHARGYRGVPTFIIDDRYEVDGAADVSDFLEQFVLARDEESAASIYSSPDEQRTEGVCFL
ncbi:DSBA oxidoreductase [Metarhizium acridum CQMa 102]|uniref:DSBA oxidoreductase n=1 Tax=Metarhizium acridum (strain CQMa 102) TaxID=655827 RepID=E9DV65_METAQ|nr:DSBA oxidoreductase [Metarhizium acridum CQMa 102]EFY92489.1 DSBA oxidoreductase [Metarhizium acridum CQMa 102]